MLSDVVMAFLPLVIFFVGIYTFVKISQFRRTNSRETIDPHVIVEVRREYAGTPRWIYKCEYCNKERERKEYFLDEDCEDFEANN